MSGPKSSTSQRSTSGSIVAMTPNGHSPDCSKPGTWLADSPLATLNMRLSRLMMRLALLLVVPLLSLTAIPVSAQSEIVGEWEHRQHEDRNERGQGPDIGEFEGLPINDAARYHAERWSPSLWTVPEHQCIPHPADYGPNFSSVRIWKDVNPLTQEVVAYHTNIAWNNPVRTIWMDGRAHPPENALHTWEGFSTGRWQGDRLVVSTTHMKPAYLRRNGVPRSDRAVLTEYFIRTGDFLTWVSIIDDPAYLTEPMIRSRDFYLNPGYQVDLYPCSIDVEVPRAEGEVPHYVDGNPDLRQYAGEYGLPWAAVQGGAATMYPEFAATMQQQSANAPEGGE